MVYRRRGMGNRGMPLPFTALGAVLHAGCPTVDLGDTPTDINLCNPAGGQDYFVSDIYPNFIKGDTPGDSKSCTQNNRGHSEGNGPELTIRFQPRRDENFNFRQAQLFLNCVNEDMSLLPTKPLTGSDAHGDGNLSDGMNDAEVQTFLVWF